MTVVVQPEVKLTLLSMPTLTINKIKKL